MAQAIVVNRDENYKRELLGPSNRVAVVGLEAGIVSTIIF